MHCILSLLSHKVIARAIVHALQSKTLLLHVAHLRAAVLALAKNSELFGSQLFQVHFVYLTTTLFLYYYQNVTSQAISGDFAALFNFY